MVLQIQNGIQYSMVFTINISRIETQDRSMGGPNDLILLFTCSTVIEHKFAAGQLHLFN